MQATTVSGNKILFIFLSCKMLIRSVAWRYNKSIISDSENKHKICKKKNKGMLKMNFIQQRNSTLPAEVSTVSDDCFTHCKNLNIRFHLPSQRSKISFLDFKLKGTYRGWDPHSWNAAKSTKDRNLWGCNPWLPPKVLEVNSKETRSIAPSWPQLRISRIKCEGKSSIETELNLSAIWPIFSMFTPHKTQEPGWLPKRLVWNVKSTTQLSWRKRSNF